MRTENSAKSGRVVCEIYEWTDRQTNTFITILHISTSGQSKNCKKCIITNHCTKITEQVGDRSAGDRGGMNVDEDELHQRHLTTDDQLPDRP